MAPHMASELLKILLAKPLENCTWPTYDPTYTVEQNTVIAIQVNGKLRGTITLAIGTSEQTIEAQASHTVAKWLEGKPIKKVIFIADKLINFII